MKPNPDLNLNKRTNVTLTTYIGIGVCLKQVIGVTKNNGTNVTVTNYTGTSAILWNELSCHQMDVTICSKLDRNRLGFPMLNVKL